MLTQTTCSPSHPTVSVGTFDTEIQTRSCRNQSYAIHETRGDYMKRYENSSKVRNPTVYLESATQLPKNHTTKSTNEHFRNLIFPPNQKNWHININLPKPQLKTYSSDPLQRSRVFLLFQINIHNNNMSLSDAQKNIYLQNALTDRAKESVLDTHIMENFTTMCQRSSLSARYAPIIVSGLPNFLMSSIITSWM